MAQLGRQTEEYIKRKRAGLVALADNAGKTMERYAKNNAPWEDKTGTARKAINGGGEKKRHGAVIFLAHGVKYGAYLEEGTGLHGPSGQSYDIFPKKKKALSWNGGGPVKAVYDYPGMKPHPIIRPTADSMRPKVMKAVQEYWRS